MAHPTTVDPPSNSIRYIPTNEAYDRWAEVYDSDGNFLQALDDLELKTLFPRFVASIKSPKPWRIVDLGCGTGRNTALLLRVPESETIALDASKGMLEVAKTRLGGSSLTPELSGNKPILRFDVFDMLATSGPPASVAPHTVDAIISTLVAEHIPLSVFFAHVSQLLRPGGVLLLTNMHSHMGSISQAGFVDTVTGEKIRPTSYAHTVEDTILEARKCGLDVETDAEGNGIIERAVSEDMVEKLGLRSGKWVDITCWFGGIFRKADS
ncbi:putative methyltransferase [Xylaria bambusicola]|uniref:putative methyltransferase n=1 Tax=Xylaria bambusicola TaxID=326684 RepID=UPI0020084832|nr:putative methyltransferase [Xylaria bambusicola]KAI0521333.1 putative methyltransferase [Xylaria bambusicola]